MLSRSYTGLTILALAACSAAGSRLDGNSSGAGDGSSGAGAGLSTGSLGAGDGSTGTGEQQCGKSTFGNEVPGALLLLVDKSGSMGDPPSGKNGTSKWTSTVSALGQMLKVASPTLQVGLLPFPAGKFNDQQAALCIIQPNAPGCAQLLADFGCTDVDKQPVVAIQPLTENAPAIASWLNQNNPGGGTPTLHALMNAYAIMKAYPAKGQRFVLLITDGEPNVATPPAGPFPAMGAECGDIPAIEKVAADAANGKPSVDTFVIGSPGSEGAKTFLSQVALNGKTAKDPACSAAAGNCHYQIGTANFEKELAGVLASIAGSVSNCIFDMPEGQNIDPNLVNVTIETGQGSSEVLKDAKHVDGWDYADGAQTKIQLFGPACDAYKAGKGNKITIILGCQSKVK